MAKITDSWLAFYEFEPRTSEDPLCRGRRYTINTLRLKRLLVSVAWKIGEGGCQLMWHSRYLTMAQNYEIRCQKPSCS
ncbi:hypothetical protein TNCV_3548361 [Trichonephila clavipes]|nr:hypothetical protein TNCV_3548361 [Trichonephila clavipes]